MEWIKVAKFYHEIASLVSVGSEFAMYVTKEMNKFRPYEIAEMVLDRLKEVTTQDEIRKIIKDDLIDNFNKSVNEYWLKRYGSEKY